MQNRRIQSGYTADANFERQHWCQQWNHVFNHLLITSFLFSVTDVFFVIEIMVGGFQLSITSSWSRCTTFVLEDWSIQVLAPKYNPIPRETMRGLHKQMWFVRRRLFKSNAFGSGPLKWAVSTNLSEDQNLYEWKITILVFYHASIGLKEPFLEFSYNDNTTVECRCVGLRGGF